MLRKVLTLACSLPLFAAACVNGGEKDDTEDAGVPNCEVPGRCVPAPDAGADVAANNGEEDVGSKGCGAGCPKDLVCNAATDTCVECLTNAECGANGVCDGDTNTCDCAPGFHACAEGCVEETSPDACGASCQVCADDPNGTRACEAGSCTLLCDAPFQLDPASGQCAACLADIDCTDPAASVCDQGACVACQDDGGCAHLGDRGICVEGTCAQCTASDETACGANSCYPETGTCTTTPRDSVALCGTCRADSECMVDSVCVPMVFGENLRPGGFCLPIKTDACTGLYGLEAVRTTLSGASHTVCTINESLTTCEAIADYGRGCADPSDCGAMGLDDGLCEPIDFDAAKCTLRCSDFDECPSSSLIGCAPGNSNGDKWCGAY